MTIPDITILHDQPIRTWFNCGGVAHRLARPVNVQEVVRCVEVDAQLRVLGDGANLLVADGGVRELVVVLEGGEFGRVEIDRERGVVSAGAGVKLPGLIHEGIKAGLCGLENLGGIPASIGGAVVMNAGGAFGQIGDYVLAVEGVTRRGECVVVPREEIRFDYRHADFGGHAGLIVTRVDLGLVKGDSAAARAKLLEVMAYKKRTQPMAAYSAGCTFKNPVLGADVAGVGVAGSRVSAGMLIDKAGCKGVRVGGAEVSVQHGNFFVTHPGCTAGDILGLMGLVARRVREEFGVELAAEVAVWGVYD
ncbi:MAG: UDP-N-acetylmuramate dehydrogenase [bacterium]